MNQAMAKDRSLVSSYEGRFHKMLEYIKNWLGDRGFRKPLNAKPTPHARFEALSVGVSYAISRKPNLGVKDNSWVDDDQFSRLVKSDSANVKSKLKGRIEYVVIKLLEE